MHLCICFDAICIYYTFMYILHIQYIFYGTCIFKNVSIHLFTCCSTVRRSHARQILESEQDGGRQSHQHSCARAGWKGVRGVEEETRVFELIPLMQLRFVILHSCIAVANYISLTNAPSLKEARQASNSVSQLQGRSTPAHEGGEHCKGPVPDCTEATYSLFRCV